MIDVDTGGSRRKVTQDPPQADLDDLYDWWRIVFARLGERGVLPTSVREIMASVELA